MKEAWDAQMEAQWQVNNSNIKNCLGNNIKFKLLGTQKIILESTKN
jgi:hypothetical protein